MSDRVVDALRALKDELLNSTTHHGYTATGFADAVNRHIAAAESRAAGSLANDMDADGGPRCHCGRPSRHESGWCGVDDCDQRIAGRRTVPVVDAIRAALDAAVCDDTSEVLPPGTLARLLAVAEREAESAGWTDQEAEELAEIHRDVALAQLATWCEARSDFDQSAAEARRLAGGPLPRLERAVQYAVPRDGCYSGDNYLDVPPEGVLLLPPSEGEH